MASIDALKGKLAGQRKTVVFSLAIVALVLMHLIGDVGAAEGVSALWKIVGAYMVGNGAEHIGKGLGKLPADPE